MRIIFHKAPKVIFKVKLNFTQTIGKMKTDRKIIITTFIVLCSFFTIWYAIPFSISRSQDALVARAFITDEADLCEIIDKSVNGKQDFTFGAYGFVYYKSGIVMLKLISKVNPVNEHTILVFFRLYSWLFFIATAIVLTLLTYQLTGLLGALIAMTFTFIASPNLLYYSAMLHPDVPQVFFIALCLYLLYVFASSGKIQYVLLSSMSAALAFSCKYSGLLVLPVIYTSIFLVEIPEKNNKTNNTPKKLATISLLVLTYFLFDTDAISKYIQHSNVGNELLVYIKSVKYISLAVLIIFVSTAIISDSLKKRLKLYRIQNVVFLLLATSWLFLGTYLLTVTNLLLDYQFLSGFIDVTHFHSMGHNLSELGGFINWFKLLIENDIFGLGLMVVFITSTIYIVLKFNELNQNIKITFFLFVLWQFIFFGIVVFRIKSMFGHFLLPLFPVIIIFTSYFIHKLFQIKSGSLKYLIAAGLALLMLERSINTISFYDKKKSEELNSSSIKAGKWLEQNADLKSIISANNYCYVPAEFKNVNFNWGTKLEDLYSENIDYILTHVNVLDDFADSALVTKYGADSDIYLNRHKLRTILLNNSGCFKLLKDFGEMKIFGKTGIRNADTLFLSKCPFENWNKANWSIAESGIDSAKAESGNKLWHFKKENEWGPTFSILLDSLSDQKEYLIEMKVKMFCDYEIPTALMVIQTNGNNEIIRWQKTEISTQTRKQKNWEQLYANLIISNQYSSKKELRLLAFIWNINNNDFYIDDFEIMVRPL